MLITVEGLVIAERNYGESDRFIDILTAEYGVIEICVRGARKLAGRNNASTQLFSYARFCFNKKGERYSLNSSEPIRVFYELRLDMKKLALAEYFIEVSRYCVTTGQSARDIMSLLLNSLHFLSKDLRSCEFLKSVFEMRFMSEIGMLPQLIGCRDCYRYDTEEMFFMADRACLLCGEHFYERGFEENEYHIRLTPSVFQALQFICLAEMKRIFNFRLGDDSLRLLNEITEKYILTRLSRGFKTLDFYNELCKTDDTSATGG
ncbi:MAG: DNA repair protein RecO [Oscillospiraceae bacterium]|nr:DNA repair protein RecO [Oscillospiraceae bacterium]